MSEADVKITREQAAAEGLRRQRARASLVEYARSIDVPGAPASEDPEAELFKSVESSIALHHRVMLEKIQKTMETKNGRLFIFAPPGSAKSSYASIVAPVWAMSKWPDNRIILAGYADTIALKHSRRARSLCRQPRQIAIWDSKPILSKEQKAVESWALSNGSEFMAAGLLSGITGNRAKGVIIDDPVKNREDADSPTIRDKTKAEYQDTVDSRLAPGGWVIIIQTRWHEDDLAGSILPEDYKGQSGPILCRDGMVWEVLNIPAEAEYPDDPLGRKPGEFLWPEWFPESHWLMRKNNPQAQRTWNALFQQRPKASEGIKFHREDFRWYDPDKPLGQPGALPLRVSLNGATDNATKDEAEAGHKDFTEHGIGGLDQHSDLYITDWWFGQKTTNITMAAAVALMQRYHPVYWAHEAGVIEHAIMPTLKKLMADAVPRAFTVFEPMPSIKNKALKLEVLCGWVAAGKVFLPYNRPWAQRLVDQLVGFPSAKFDDAADTAGLMARLLDKMMQRRVKSKEPRPVLKPFTGKWVEHQEQPDRKVRYR